MPNETSDELESHETFALVYSINSWIFLIYILANLRYIIDVTLVIENVQM